MKKLLLFLLAFWSMYVSAQNISSKRWTDLFSYNNVLAIREDHGKLIAATDNGLFYYTPSTGEITKLSKANGLHEVKITAFDYNPETKTGLVGYASGALDVITPEGITYVVDIPIATGYNGDKRINHISISGNLAVISVGYGVSIFRLDKKEFGDSAFFNEASREAIIKDNVVYVVTASGLKFHAMNLENGSPDPKFAIYNTWTLVSPGNFTQLASGSVIAYANSSNVFYGTGSTFNALSASFTSVQDVEVTGQNIVVTGDQQVSVFSTNGTQTQTKSFEENLNTAFLASGKIYAGSRLSGILDEGSQKIKPDGPYSNVSYKIDLVGGQIVVSTGGRDAYNTPIAGRDLGYYHYDGSAWHYPQLFFDKPAPWNVLDAVINPAKPHEIFFVNYVSSASEKGIYRMENNELKKMFATGSKDLERVAGLTFDQNNQLFVSGSRVSDKLGFYLYNPSSDSYSFVPTVSVGDAQKPFTQDGLLFIPAPYKDPGGVMIYDYKNTPTVLSDDQYIFVKEQLKLPLSGTVSLALDKSNDLWIGTRSGLRVLSDPKSAVASSNVTTEPVIIEENGVGEELFRDTEILQIAVDGGNQKWISTDGGGVFYLSPNGQRTISHFTKENSPLPNNSVTDIKVDERTGKVYFATLDGIMVYQGDVIDVNENFGNVLVYPNPVVYSQYKGNVRIRGLAEKTNIRITDVAGNLVHQAVARGGSYEWNLSNQRGMRVASGIYFVLMTNADGTDTATAKIAVVN